MRLLDEAKKLAVRLTGANYDDIKCNCLSEVFNFTVKNLNVDESGNLIVKEYVEPSNPSQPSEGGGGNLLKTAYKFAEVWNLTDSERYVLIDRLGLVPGKTYKATGYYGGESLDSDVGATRFELTTIAVDGAEMMGMEDTSGLEYIIHIGEGIGTITIGVYDGFYIDMSNGTQIVDSSKSMLGFGLGGNDSAQTYAKNFVLESIVEVEASNNVLSEPFTLTSENAQYMSDKVIEGLIGGDNVAVKYTIDGGAEQTANGVIVQAYGPNGEIGVQSLVNNTEEEGPIILAGDSENGILFMGYLNSKSLVTIGDGSTFASMFNGTYDGSSSVVTITAIEKA